MRIQVVEDNAELTQWLRRLRARQDETPVLVLTANNTVQSRVSELDRGADDDRAKPCEIEELEARIRRLARLSKHHFRRNQIQRCKADRLEHGDRIFAAAPGLLRLRGEFGQFRLNIAGGNQALLNRL